MVDITLDEEEEAIGAEGRRRIARRGTSGDHEILTATKCCGKWLAEEKKWQRFNQTYQKQLCTNPSGDCKNITRR